MKIGRVFENRVLREIVGLKRVEVTGEWSRLHTEELHAASSPIVNPMIKSRRMRWAGHVACMGERRGVYRVLVGETWGNETLGRPRRRWEDNIKMDLHEVDEEAQAGLIWLRTGTGDGRL